MSSITFITFVVIRLSIKKAEKKLSCLNFFDAIFFLKSYVQGKKVEELLELNILLKCKKRKLVFYFSKFSVLGH